LQFEATLTPLRTALNVGNFGLTHDWIINGCCDDLAHAVERPFHQGRLAEFMASDVAWIAANRGSTITDWSFAFFYYCRTRAALFELAVILLPATLRANHDLGSTDERVIECQCMI